MEAIQLEILEKIAVQRWICCTGGFDLSGFNTWWWCSFELLECSVQGQENRERIVYGIGQLLRGSCIIEYVGGIDGDERQILRGQFVEREICWYLRQAGSCHYERESNILIHYEGKF